MGNLGTVLAWAAFIVRQQILIAIYLIWKQAFKNVGEITPSSVYFMVMSHRCIWLSNRTGKLMDSVQTLQENPTLQLLVLFCNEYYHFWIPK